MYVTNKLLEQAFIKCRGTSDIQNKYHVILYLNIFNMQSCRFCSEIYIRRPRRTSENLRMTDIWNIYLPNIIVKHHHCNSLLHIRIKEWIRATIIFLSQSTYYLPLFRKSNFLDNSCYSYIPLKLSISIFCLFRLIILDTLLTLINWASSVTVAYLYMVKPHS